MECIRTRTPVRERQGVEGDGDGEFYVSVRGGATSWMVQHTCHACRMEYIHNANKQAGPHRDEACTETN